MRRISTGLFLLGLLAFLLSGCHEFSEDANEPTPAAGSTPPTEVTVKQGETANLGGIQVAVLQSEFANSQLKISVRVENKSSEPLMLKTSNFTAIDSTSTEGLTTTCGGTGGFSGELAPGEKIESGICWFLVGAKPPITITYVPGSAKRGKATIILP
ncbi:MAG: DUF4352 domain-containing protein [Chloroflexi bacterium]|nr:DUF4352 domain-containing protein [Chloroflexota bacterium]